MAIAWNLISVGLPAIIAVMMIIYFRKVRDKTKVKAAVTVGILLSVCDYVLETAGKITGYWESLQGTFYLGYVPIEIMIITFFGGMMWCMLLPVKRNNTFSILYCMVSILYCVFLESKLVDLGLFPYGNGWTSFHALAVYTMIIFLIHEAFYYFHARFSGQKFEWFTSNMNYQ